MPLAKCVQAKTSEENPFLEGNPSVKFSIVGPYLSPAEDAKGEFAIKVTIPKNHHAYLSSGETGAFIPLSFDFSGVKSAGYKILPLSNPEGKYDNEVNAMVLRGAGEFKFSIRRIEGREFIIPPIKAKSQICNDLTKICFLPNVEEIILIIKEEPKKNSGAGIKSHFSAPESALPKTSFTPPEGEGFTGKINSLYHKFSNNFLLAFTFIFISGILAAGTPCVYPMIPITSAIIMERGKSKKQLGIYHSIFYFLGIVCVYMALGVIAGITGGAFNAVMQNSFVNFFFALIFGFLGIAMLGLFNFTIGEDFTTKISSAIGQRGGMAGTFFMGMTAGLIISPCVGPVVFALLLQIADRVAEANAVITELGQEGSFLKKSIYITKGGIMMGGFGIGIGIPFLLVGLLSNLTPRAGAWMEYLKRILGLAILYIAWIYYMKGISAFQIGDQAAYSILLGIVAVFFSIYLGLFRSEKNRVKKWFSFILILPALYFLYNGFSQSGRFLQEKDDSYPSKLIAQSSAKIERHENLEWYREFEEAKKLALKENKPIFIDFFAYWCANCLEFEKLSIKNEKLNQGLRKAVLVKIYDTDPIFKKFRDNPLHRELKIGLPYFTILKPNGEFFWKGTQYNAVDKMADRINAAIAPR